MKTLLEKVPGIGPKMEEDLTNLGYTTVESLRGADPEDMYIRDCLLHGCQLDRCVLYVYRCAVYFASTKHPDPEKLKWWNWRDDPNQDRIQIIPAVQKSQLRAICTLADKIWNQHYTLILSQAQIDFMVSKFQSIEAIEQQMQSGGYQYFLLRFEDEDIGYAGIQLEDNRLFLSKLYILREAQGHGAARVVLSFLEEIVRQNTLSAIWLTVNKHNTHSIAVYEHMGFSKLYEQTSDIGGGFVMDDYVMEKTIS